MWWNHGDCYGSSPPGNSRENIEQWASKGDGLIGRKFNRYGDFKKPQSIKQKCLALQNFRLLIRMIDEQDWILRNIVIWNKPNAMPSSVKDRLTNKYEPVFMLVKSKKYWFDLDAIREKHKEISLNRIKYNWNGHREKMSSYENMDIKKMCHPSGKNPGDVWTIPTQPYPEAHFATYPEKLVVKPILSSCPEWVCRKCGRARTRIINKSYMPTRPGKNTGTAKSGTEIDPNQSLHIRNISKYRMKINYYTIGWTDCGCNAGWHPGVVLDPFAGSGTTLAVAKRFNRHFIGYEINKEYIKLIKKRLDKESNLFNRTGDG